MNVLFITSWYPSKLDATVGNFIERHALALESQGHEVVVLHETSSHRIWLPAVEFNIQSGIPVFHLYVPKLLRHWKFLRLMLAKKALQMILKDHFEPEIVHGHVLHPVGPLAVEVSKHLQRPLVFTEHWSGFLPVNTPKLTDQVLRDVGQTVEYCSRVMPVSEDLKRSMIGLGLETEYEVVYNAVDTALFNTQSSERIGKFAFLHISNFAPGIKNTEGIIDAFAALQKDADKNQATELVIAGDGDVNRLKSYARESHPELDSVRFIGSLDYPEVARLMKQCSCFVLFSNYENLPCVVAEAHCCGLPVIATEVGGLPEMVDVTNGILVQPNDTHQLAMAMQQLLKNHGHYQADSISQQAAARYGYPVIAERFEQIYLASIERKERGR